ncbi:hypothetical protein J14TS2_46690 [Bacillus sp. J14TS2]|uniref:hypothetical protein n=1 Tax=Bacillus sp. J14TS2 TaxID=2807188 RepID=UPI001B079FEF|nr:hypothetical protein [Bacillus sp. J14TS2]GIN74194.1 hypothetical protein J14TS2_46690 [Bacillus sp. J14TS2]
MRAIPVTFKNILVILIFIAMTYGFTWLYINFNETIKDKPVEETIEIKYSKKGLYLYPRFEILVSNSERPSSVTKEQFESIHVGDKISGYMKNEETFVTEKDIQFEKLLGIPILAVLYLATFSFGIGLLKNVTWIKKWTNILQRIVKVSISILLIIYVTTGFVLTVLAATNIFHKINKWNLTEVEATVWGGDYDITRSYKGASYTTYELLLHYQDESGKDHLTKKAVTNTTYKQYDVNQAIPLLYRNNDVYDTFVFTKSINEIWPAFFNLYTFFLGFYYVSIFAMLKAWRKRKRKQVEEETRLGHN